jgi:hypothetical protein
VASATLWMSARIKAGSFTCFAASPSSTVWSTHSSHTGRATNGSSSTVPAIRTGEGITSLWAATAGLSINVFGGTDLNSFLEPNSLARIDFDKLNTDRDPRGLKTETTSSACLLEIHSGRLGDHDLAGRAPVLASSIADRK